VRSLDSRGIGRRSFPAEPADQVFPNPSRARQLRARGHRSAVFGVGGRVVIGWHHLCCGVALDPGVVHDARLSGVVGASPVEHTPVVPDDNVARAPTMLQDSWWSTRIVEKTGQEPR
jgi:hypothetical protein